MLMISTIVISILIGSILTPKIASDEILVPIKSSGRFGFVNLQGKVVIPPKFRKVGKFSGSLCPARLEGLYGYIDRKGEYIIPPIYDYAEDFKEGRAIVYDSNGHPSSIDRAGKIIIVEEKVSKDTVQDSYDWQMYTPPEAHKDSLSSFTEVSKFRNHKAFAIKNDSLLCFIDETGKILKFFPNIHIGNWFQSLGFQSDFLVINSDTKKPRKWLNYVIDTSGNILYASDYQIKATENPRYYLSKAFGKQCIVDIKLGKISFPSDTSFTDFSSDDFNYITVFKEDSIAYITYDGKIFWRGENNPDWYDYRKDEDKKITGSYWLAGLDKKLSRDTLLMGNISELKLKTDTSFTIIAAGVDSFFEDGEHRHSRIAQKFIFANTSQKPIRTTPFLFCIMQAKSPKGEWKDIEEEEFLMCGTGIRILSIPAGKYLFLAGPLYSGGFKTKLRLRYENVYSNEFDGSVNPAQFWRR